MSKFFVYRFEFSSNIKSDSDLEPSSNTNLENLSSDTFKPLFLFYKVTKFQSLSSTWPVIEP